MKFSSTLLFCTAQFIATSSIAQECYVDSTSPIMVLDSVRALHDYNGVRPANFAGVETFSNGAVYLNSEEALYHFDAPSVPDLSFDRSYLQFGNNGLPSPDFINIKIGNTPLIATITDSLDFHLSPFGYTVQVITNPGSATDFQNFYIYGNIFSSFSIGTGAGSSISNICVNLLVKVEESQLNFEVFPNPSDGIIHIKTDANFSDIKIINCIGSVVYQSNLAPTRIDVSHLPSGVYFVQLSNAEQSSIKKIVIN